MSRSSVPSAGSEVDAGLPGVLTRSQISWRGLRGPAKAQRSRGTEGPGPSPPRILRMCSPRATPSRASMSGPGPCGCDQLARSLRLTTLGGDLLDVPVSDEGIEVSSLIDRNAVLGDRLIDLVRVLLPVGWRKANLRLLEIGLRDHALHRPEALIGLDDLIRAVSSMSISTTALLDRRVRRASSATNRSVDRLRRMLNGEPFPRVPAGATSSCCTKIAL